MSTVTRTYRWLVLYTRYRQERIAERYLRSCGIEVFLPLHKEIRQRTDRKVWIHEPLFPCYIFVKVSCREFDKALQNKAILSYVTFGGLPCVVPDHEIVAVKKILNDSVEYQVTCEQLAPGDQVLIIDGPLTGYCAEVVVWHGRERLLIKIEGVSKSLILTSEMKYVIQNKQER